MADTNRVALVTGASSGIGKEIARRLIADGLTVYAAARRTDKMADLAEAGVTVLALDITDEASIEAVVAAIAAAHGGVDVLVNNAGFGLYGSVEDTSIADARYQFDVNLFGLARLTQLLLPAMREKGAGTIVNITSMGGKIYTPLGAWYHASKHALEGWSDCLRLELAPFGIHVVVVEPGIIETAFGDVLMGPMLERSGKGAYADFADKVAKATRNSYERGGGSSPTVIADVVSRAVKAGRPKTRYVAGRLAWPMIQVRKWLGDRVFDRMVMSAVR
ncbi:oxidoreductase [Bauldia sp.]|uniref:oxidoreductase n=1 Tax=Bauldia sp. TaxID=2575872 RepID=UPI003BAA3C5C